MDPAALHLLANRRIRKQITVVEEIRENKWRMESLERVTIPDHNDIDPGGDVLRSPGRHPFSNLSLSTELEEIPFFWY